MSVYAYLLIDFLLFLIVVISWVRYAKSDNGLLCVLFMTLIFMWLFLHDWAQYATMRALGL